MSILRLCRIAGQVLRALCRSVFFTFYGLYVVVGGLSGLLAEASASARLLRRALPCPSCGAANALHGRFECRSCSAVFHGFVGECPLCGAGARFFPCSECGVSVAVRRRV